MTPNTRSAAIPPEDAIGRTPPPASLVAALALALALALARTQGRSTEIVADEAPEVRFAAEPTNGPQTPHRKDEIYFVASGSARYRVNNVVTDVTAGDILFCAANLPNGFEDNSDDFSVWVLFYGPEK